MARRKLRLLSVVVLPVLLLVAACNGNGNDMDDETPEAAPELEAPADCPEPTTEVELVADNIAFDTDCFSVPAGEDFTVELTNEDSEPHNVAIYRTADADDPFFRGEIFTGPDEVRTEDVDGLEEGTYYFQCDPHPVEMNGVVVVE